MAKQQAIDGSVPVGDLVLYDTPEIDADLGVEFIDSPELEVIEDGIRQIQGTTDLLSLIQGVAIVRIEQEGLWRQAGFDTLHAYRIVQNERLGMPRQTVSRRRLVGEGWLDNRKALGKFPLSGHVEKLRLLNQAVALFGKKDAIASFKAMSFREFDEWIRPRVAAPDLPDVDLAIREGQILLDGTALLGFDEDLPEEERDFLGRLLRAGYRARRGANLAHVVGCYDEGEARAVDNFLKKLRASK